MENESLFSEFPEVSSKQWKQKVQFDLKGADYNETLVWESLEGIHVKPFYHQEDLRNTPISQLPKNHSWHIGQSIFVANAAAANKKALDVLERGASTLVFTVSDASTSWETLLSGIDTKITPVHFNVNFLDLDAVKGLLSIIGTNFKQIHLNIDIIGNLARTGNWFYNREKDIDLLSKILELTKKSNITSSLSVEASIYQNAGANIIQQLAYALAHAHEYLHLFGYDTATVLDKISTPVFKIAVGNNYFFEIAKIKALRWLWKSLAPAYNLKNDCHILAYPSKRNKTIYDYNVNMLRTTSECMAAVLGGADTVCNLSYDSLYHKDNEFGERIARNQLLLLKEESYFDDAVWATEGAYYIESLTQQFAEKALELFKQIEKAGGLLKQLNEGVIQRKIKESAQKEQDKFDSGELVLLGTNSYQNPNDRMQQELELYPFVKTNKQKTSIEPIIEKRLAERLEKERLEKEGS